ncbi:hypothetical protein KJR33_05770 [Pediococcus pentosaceus]|uniref:tagaturonate epimerase family protein n=1 Tax=Pediococcus pentosaceus TaxID=1255 RepID=UPI001F18491D|nr:tagaturonate epimerase family protein [Pediococcus pentosaceus]MCE5960622.1 hypothetical protein [Pediococcus pentosaceus]
MNLKNLLTDVKTLIEDRNADVDSGIYKPSVQIDRRNVYLIYREGRNKSLVVYEDARAIKDFQADECLIDDDYALIKAPLNFFNNKALAKRFAWINPSSRHGYKYTLGLGDRLGNASNAHLKLLKGKGIFPVLAQQSIRELLLSNRTFTDVIQAASWSVFEEGYTDGWGADGDHVKNAYEIDYAVRSGATMITLDLTEKTHTEFLNYSDEDLDAEYNKLSDEIRHGFEEKYLNKKFDLGNGQTVEFTNRDLKESVLVFNEGVLFAEYVNEKFVKPFALDFEISVDETPVSTTPAQHYFFANELADANVTPETLAPRFYGEFQKGIDYIGDLARFEKEFAEHEAIAEKFGYKLSVHSGSDKLSAYPIIARLANGYGWHVKTAGTNWLEALRVVAHEDPKFMLELYKFSYDNLDDVKAFYVFNAQTDGKAPKPETLTEDDVKMLLVDDDARQVLHTMYGSILGYTVNYKNVYRDRLFDILETHTDEYDRFLNIHMAEHVDLLQGVETTKEAVLAKYEPKN